MSENVVYSTVDDDDRPGGPRLICLDCARTFDPSGYSTLPRQAQAARRHERSHDHTVTHRRID
jgi:hypothetical protein